MNDSENLPFWAKFAVFLFASSASSAILRISGVLSEHTNPVLRFVVELVVGIAVFIPAWYIASWIEKRGFFQQLMRDAKSKRR
ncbi:hypothetical protein OPU71_21030 [Niveibacterium sp. 24ML]|uniref:hypothetical protein n=1 Tax=Niveibacterium sp. 24ML TaxID=2985512 RepID=UPI002271AA7B|nr:hypothetical protein [Niveibacterium sp. 24ML]MCX9158605.1 hypothetical protein [Niveibacterium sp. 24ML]